MTAAWTIATETESALKEGNYVQGTVLMVLRKQTSAETAFLDEVVPEVETEVERQLDAMLRLDDREAPNFSDADYQLAAYAAALAPPRGPGRGPPVPRRARRQPLARRRRRRAGPGGGQWRTTTCSPAPPRGTNRPRRHRLLGANDAPSPPP